MDISAQWFSLIVGFVLGILASYLVFYLKRKTKIKKYLQPLDFTLTKDDFLQWFKNGTYNLFVIRAKTSPRILLAVGKQKAYLAMPTVDGLAPSYTLFKFHSKSDIPVILKEYSAYEELYVIMKKVRQLLERICTVTTYTNISFDAVEQMLEEKMRR